MNWTTKVCILIIGGGMAMVSLATLDMVIFPSDKFWTAWKYGGILIIIIWTILSIIVGMKESTKTTKNNERGL